MKRLRLPETGSFGFFRSPFMKKKPVILKQAESKLKVSPWQVNLVNPTLNPIMCRAYSALNPKP